MYTITFLNNSRQTYVTWVCQNKTVYDFEMARLGAMPHCQIVNHGMSMYIGETSDPPHPSPLACRIGNND